MEHAYLKYYGHLVSRDLDSESPIYKHGAAAATGISDSSINSPDHDEDIKDEIVDHPNVIAEVKLPGNAR
jgi:hypothetical protein